jgi:hypothetical protein
MIGSAQHLLTASGTDFRWPPWPPCSRPHAPGLRPGASPRCRPGRCCMQIQAEQVAHNATRASSPQLSQNRSDAVHAEGTRNAT